MFSYMIVSILFEVKEGQTTLSFLSCYLFLPNNIHNITKDASIFHFKLSDSGRLNYS
jgi:hypothetical protein